MKKHIVLYTLLITTILIGSSFTIFQNNNHKILSHIVDLEKQHLEFYWKDKNGNNFYNFNNLKKWVNKKNEELVFATNGGMYLKDRSPQGLFYTKWKNNKSNK